MQVDDRVAGLLADVLQLPAASITDDLTMQDVESWDSLKHMELIVSLEESFGQQFTFDEIVAMQSVSAIKRVLREKGAQN